MYVLIFIFPLFVPFLGLGVPLAQKTLPGTQQVLIFIPVNLTVKKPLFLVEILFYGVCDTIGTLLFFSLLLIVQIVLFLFVV